MPSRHPVTYFPVPTQRAFAANAEAIRGKPYAHYFNGDLWLHDEAVAAIRAPMPLAHALPCTPQGFDRLLEPGDLAGETGYCELPGGGAYVASRVPFPGCTGEMLKWWFWWHAVEPARYTLWYPTNHLSARSLSPEKLSAPGLTHEQRYLGTSHRVLEWIGPKKVDVLIDFVDPADLGMDTRRFAEAGIVAHACARVRTGPRPRARVVTMLHLARATADGFELRSRYWIANDLRLEVFGSAVPVGPLLRGIGVLPHLAGAAVGYEQLLHDQIEFTHLSTFLAPLHAEFGAT
ncbi:MAG: hypothetical protein ABW252_04275 [Polyangiales bacterium]